MLVGGGVVWCGGVVVWGCRCNSWEDSLERLVCCHRGRLYTTVHHCTVHYNPASPSISWCPSSLASPVRLDLWDRYYSDLLCDFSLLSRDQTDQLCGDQSPPDPAGGGGGVLVLAAVSGGSCWLCSILIGLEVVCCVSPASLAELNRVTPILPVSFSQTYSQLSEVQWEAERGRVQWPEWMINI